VQWDGALGGRVDTILRYTERSKRKKARDFLSNVKLMPPLVAECFREQRRREARDLMRAPEPFVFLARYTDNVYIALLNVPTEVEPHVRLALLSLLSGIYSIKLK